MVIIRVTRTMDEVTTKTSDPVCPLSDGTTSQIAVKRSSKKVLNVKNLGPVRPNLFTNQFHVCKLGILHKTGVTPVQNVNENIEVVENNTEQNVEENTDGVMV